MTVLLLQPKSWRFYWSSPYVSHMRENWWKWVCCLCIQVFPIVVNGHSYWASEGIFGWWLSYEHGSPVNLWLLCPCHICYTACDHNDLCGLLDLQHLLPYCSTHVFCDHDKNLTLYLLGLPIFPASLVDRSLKHLMLLSGHFFMCQNLVPVLLSQKPGSCIHWCIGSEALGGSVKGGSLSASANVGSGSYWKLNV